MQTNKKTSLMLILMLSLCFVSLYSVCTVNAQEAITLLPQTCSQANYFKIQTDRQSIGETFNCTTTGYITQITTTISQTSDVTPRLSAQLRCYIYDTTGTYGSTMTPSGAQLTSSASLQVSGWTTTTSTRTFSFSGTFQIVANHKYAVVLTTSGFTTYGGSDALKVWGLNGPAGYSGNSFHKNPAGTWNTTYGDWDMSMQIYGTLEPLIATPAPIPSTSWHLYIDGMGSVTTNGTYPYNVGDIVRIASIASEGWEYTETNYLNNATVPLIHSTDNPYDYVVKELNSIVVVFTNTDPAYDYPTPTPMQDKITPVFDSVGVFLFGEVGVLGAGFGLIVLVGIVVLLVKLGGRSMEMVLLGSIIATIVNVAVGIWEIWTIILIIIAVVALALKNSGVLNSTGE